MAPDLTILVNQLQTRISSMEETINKHMAEKTAWMAQQSKLMDLILSLNETIKSLQVPTTQQPLGKKKVTNIAASGEGSSSADSMHTPTQSSAKESYAVKAAKAAKAEKKPTLRKQTKARAPTVDTMKRILSEPTGPSSYKFVYLPCRHHLRHSAVRKLLTTVKVPQSRVIDVQFPAKGTVALLVHSEYHQELTENLESHGISTKKEFNPFAADIIGDQQHANKTVRTCLRLPQHLGNSIMRFFTAATSVYKLPDNTFAQYLEKRKGTAPPSLVNKADTIAAFQAIPPASDNAMDGVEETAPINNQ
ncbi:hypothetical protein DFQ28_001032 [Apophysomyces sp. BC1034]|nr:hypothetical protein DFQ28_001032 [Apophysomyces sp. BC1034]